MAIAALSSLPLPRVCPKADIPRIPRARRGVILGCSTAAPSEVAKAGARSPGMISFRWAFDRMDRIDLRFVFAVGWKTFSKNASGEWSGAAVDFDREGKPLQLPSALVPQEYVEWEVEVCDWETYCATLADGDPPRFYNKTLRLYPTVGCGATTVSIYSTQEQALDEAKAEKQKFLAFHPSGSYVAVWDNENEVVVEHCLVNEDIEGLRMRVLHKFGELGMPVEGITVYKEQWEESFQSGKTVESCLTRHAAFAGGPRLKPSDLRGTWQTIRRSFSPVEGCGCVNKMVLEASNPVERTNAKGCILLPEGTWSSIRKVENELVIEAGLLTRPGNLVLSRCKVTSSGEIQAPA
ncbi:uncharacterized protein LOC9629590 [Selaginella moellendorffii]|uniref:uncharacterized protein LOC9629590 n=1 Tax=Selaginella moellendorffii TaxID=88036 RepID=UPI000D1CE2AD|nr:uncharacterized protein LOC9629590 [Selaginella moellendorffii]|eukprot:XP_024536103.1 uncharacterized protein LOC9629590 [Selaginella moellendorffii]